MARPKRTDLGRKELHSDDYTGFFYIDPDKLDPAYHYAFVELAVHGKESQSYENAVRRGYEPVLREEIPDDSKIAELMAEIRGTSGRDKYVVKGNQILVKCRKELVNKRLSKERKENELRMRSVESVRKNVGAPFIEQQNSYDYSRARGFADDEE